MSLQSPEQGGSWRSPFIKVFALIFLGFWLITATIVVVDPLDLYDWGAPPRLLPDYNRDHTEHLYAAVSRAKLDALFIGSSTTAMFTSEDLRQAFPAERRAFNLSVSGPRPYDRALLTSLVSKHSPARHLLLGVDWFYVLPARQVKANVPVHLYDDAVANDLRVASPTVLRLLARTLQGQPLALADWDYAAGHRDDQRRWTQFQRREMLEEIRGAVSATREAMTVNAGRRCADYGALQQQLLPFIRDVSRQGRRLDLLIPPYSLAFYAIAEARPAMGGQVLANQIGLRRCLVEAVDGLPGVHVYAFDNETWITGDLANYGDEGHLYNDAIKRYILTAISAGNHRLTHENMDAYARTLRANVASYEPHNSALNIQ